MSLFYLGIALIGSYFWLWKLLRYDPIEPEPIKAVFKLFMGGLIAIFFVVKAYEIIGINVGNLGPGTSLSEYIQTFLQVGFFEEFFKFLAFYLLAKNLKELDEPVDAMIYGITVALGFATFENFTYMIHHGPEVIGARLILSVPGHMIWAGLWSYGFAKYKFLHFKEIGEYNSEGVSDASARNYNFFACLKVVSPYLLLAIFLHATYNVLCSYNLTLVLCFPLLILNAKFNRRLFNHLVSQSTHLKAGECFNCRHQNSAFAIRCKECKFEILRAFYKLCKSCLKKVSIQAASCPFCKEILPEKITDNHMLFPKKPYVSKLKAQLKKGSLIWKLYFFIIIILIGINFSNLNTYPSTLQIIMEAIFSLVLILALFHVAFDTLKLEHSVFKNLFKACILWTLGSFFIDHNFYLLLVHKSPEELLTNIHILAFLFFILIIPLIYCLYHLAYRDQKRLLKEK